jgi:NO-binding membrane sensor protein with MHYT domain
MPDVSTHVTLSSFDPALLGLSFLLAVFGAWCGLWFARHARRQDGAVTPGWLVTAACALGAGALWSMHFMGLLAYQGEVVYSIDLRYALLALAAAVAASLLGLMIATRSTQRVGQVIGGLVVGAGMAAMHYLAVTGMQMNATAGHEPGLVAASLVIAVLASAVGLVVALRGPRTWHLTVGAVVLGLGATATYVTGMLGLTLTPTLGQVDLGITDAGIEPFSLAMPIFAIAALMLFVLLFAGIFEDRSFEDADGEVVEREPQPAV